MKSSHVNEKVDERVDQLVKLLLVVNKTFKNLKKGKNFSLILNAYNIAGEYMEPQAFLKFHTLAQHA